MRSLANPLGYGLLALAACSGERPPSPATGVAPRVLEMAELAAAVKQNLGRGTLVNVWATW